MNDFITPITLLHDDPATRPVFDNLPSPLDFAIGAFQEVVRLRDAEVAWEYFRHRTLKVWLHHAGNTTIELCSSGVGRGEEPQRWYWVTVASGHGASAQLQKFSTVDATEAMEVYVALASPILQRAFIPARHPDVVLVDGKEKL